jgi:uncharacterized protein YeaO (DUF488 family)
MGRLITCRVGDTVTADVRLQITRSSRGLVEGWIWVPQLAPPEDLFEDYLRWKHRGEWPGRWPEYRQRFLAYMWRPEPRAYLARIRQRLAEGKSVALACFCPDERYCHRSLVAGLVQSVKPPI